MRHGGSKKVTAYYQARSATIRNAWWITVIVTLAVLAYINRQEIGQELQKLSKESVSQLTKSPGNH